MAGEFNIKNGFISNSDSRIIGGLTASTVSATTITATTITSTGDLRGFSLVSTQSIGDEGGEIRMNTAQTNNTLSGGSITFDVYQNRLRFFETGGSNRGVYIDLSTASAGVGTNLVGGGSVFTGGTVTGPTTFTAGLTSNSISSTTISATTYQNLPIDIRVTGGTYTDGTATFRNNTGGTFSVTGFTGNYWSSGSTGTYSLKAINDSGLNATGDYSIAMNYNTLASGLYSYAEGESTIASGNISHAEGQNTRASGVVSHSEGESTTASGSHSHAEGRFSIASGNTSHAEGEFTTAGGQYSHAEGNLTTASGSTSHAEGIYSKAIGSYSHAEGNLTIAGGDASHAEGDNTQALGNSSHAEGSSTIASGSTSHAEGINTTASGDYSHAEGNTTIASGSSSHAEGVQTQANGDNSHAQGFNTRANGSSSHAGGSDSIAQGNYSFVHGLNSNANGNHTVVFGNNITGTADNTVYTPYLNIQSVQTNNALTNVLVRETDGTIKIKEIGLTNVVNLVTVGLSGSIGVNYNSIKAAVNSITGATSANTYVVKVGPGVFYEDTITMKSYVDVIGESETNTIIQANNPNATLIIGADQSMISDVQIQGCTGTSVAAVVYSSSTTPQLNAIFYVENVRFGANYTHAKTVGTGGGNCIMQCSNVKYGGYPFTLGFYVTNDGSGVGRMQLRNVTSTNGGVTTTTGLIFAKADQPSCAFIVNGCLLTKATGAAAGTGFWVENGGSLRLTGVNFQRWETGIYAPQTGSAPSIEAIALNFENCTTDVNIVHSGTTGKIQGTDNYSKTLININAPLYEVNQDPRIISVAKKGGDFSSIKSAVDSITGSSINNRFLISVGPGRFTEGLIDLTGKPYVSIEGSNILTTEIVPSGNTQHIIKIGSDNELSFLSLSGAPSGYAGIYVYDIGDYGQAHKVSFNDCHTNIWIESVTKDTTFYGEYLDFNGSYSYGTKVIGNNGFTALANMENYYNFPTGTGVTICNYASGSGATLNVFIGDNSSNGVSGSTAFQIQDAAGFNATTITIDGFTYGIRNTNVGLPVRFDIDNASIVNCEWDLYVENLNSSGTFGGSSNHEKIYTASENVSWGFLDINDGEFEVTRKISVTFQDGSHTDLSTLVFGGGTMGLISGGTLSVVSGTTVQVLKGFGYLKKSDTSGIVRRIDWGTSQLILSANTNNYLFFNENTVLSTSGSLPDSVNNIILGRVVTDSTSVRFIDSTPVNADHTVNRFSSIFREAIGSIYAFGSIVTENATKFRIDVTSGEYYYASNEFLPSGGTNISFTQYYRNGVGGWNTSATTVVNNSTYDGNGALSALTAGYYTKHTLYVVGDGSNQKYFLVLGQNQYPTLIQTEDALLPTPPSFFSDSVVQIASIYIQQGYSGITQIQDIRPVIGFKAGGVNASSLHANLLGLASDDHTQYLLANGGRNMSGNLNMGANNITNVGTVDGVTVSSHASRHLPNGLDPLTTAVPVNVSTSNIEGTANSFARSDHQHGLGSNVVNDSNISAHTSTKITILNKSLLNTNIVYNDQLNTGVTATTISATTITTDTILATTISGDGSGITNVTALVPYGIINAISSGNFLT